VLQQKEERLRDIPSHHDILDHEANERDDDEQVTVWEPDQDNGVHVWFENADGECSIIFSVEERVRLIHRLAAGTGIQLSPSA
jgi:hypothetical protein